MVPSETFLSLLFATLAVVQASPPIHRNGGKGTLQFTRRLRLDGISGRTLVQKDRARAHSMMEEIRLSKRSDASVSITSSAFDLVAQIGVGEPPHYYTLVIDTGSSNTWVGANNTRPYIQTKASIDTGNRLGVVYGSGNITGEEWLDTLTLTPDLAIKNQSIGAASFVNGTFEDIDGIIGLGPVDLTSETVNNTALVPTVMDNLYSQKLIPEEVLGIYFIPSAKDTSTGGLTFGSYDGSVITSPVEYVPRIATGAASLYWGITQSVSYGNQTILSNAAGLVDSGTTLIYLATVPFQKYQKLTGAVLDNSTGLLAINPAQYAKLKPLSFKIGGMCLDLTPDAQIWPRSLNYAIGGNASTIYLIVQEIGEMMPFELINGHAFLQRFYSIYDTTSNRLGFARTAYTESVINYSQ